MSKRRIAVVTGSRAEYGLLRWVMDGIAKSPELQLQVIVTGAHLSPQFGSTYREIEKDGFAIDYRVEADLSSDTPAGVTRSMGQILMGFADALEALRPDLMVVLGDRYEILSAAAAALIARVPVAHLHGGEASEGAFDEAIRHAVTKMSHLHFVAAPEYRDRVIQLGESPDRVFVVGGLGIDNIHKLKLLARAALEKALGLSFAERNLLVTFHPVTLDRSSSAGQMAELLAALSPLTDTRLIFTMPNADTEGRALWEMIEKFAAAHPNTYAFKSLGQLNYLSCLQFVDGVVGNSSSGLLEVPSFHKGTVNIGRRQQGRLKAESVIDCAPDRESIAAAIERLYSPAFQALLPGVQNPYGNGGASERIVAILANTPLDNLTMKSFCDIPREKQLSR